jgi:hypothetical protein
MDQSDLNGGRAIIGSAASIMIPYGTELSKNKTMPDFSVYYVVRRSGAILGIYVGNAPGYQDNTQSEKINIGGCSAVSVRSVVNGAHGRDILIDLGDAHDFPKWLHLFYRNQDTDTALLSDQTVESLRFLDGYGCPKTEGK